MLGVSIVFDYTAWVTRYPALAGVGPTQGQNFFNEATVYWRNNGTGPVSLAATQTVLLWQLTAHIAILNPGSWLTPPGPVDPAGLPVGRLSDAAEGSVHASFQNDYAPGTPQWYQQTQPGAAFWAATAQYRTMRYRPGSSYPSRGLLPGNPGFRGW